MAESCVARAAALIGSHVERVKSKLARKFCCSSCGRIIITQFSANPELFAAAMLVRSSRPLTFQIELGGNLPNEVWYSSSASPNCLMLFAHCSLRADSRAACTAGKSSPTRIPMIVMTTNNSTSVNPRRALARPRRANISHIGPFLIPLFRLDPKKAFPPDSVEAIRRAVDRDGGLDTRRTTYANDFHPA